MWAGSTEFCGSPVTPGLSASPRIPYLHKPYSSYTFRPRPNINPAEFLTPQIPEQSEKSQNIPVVQYVCADRINNFNRWALKNYKPIEYIFTSTDWSTEEECRNVFSPILLGMY